MGGLSFFEFKYFSLLILGLYTDFELHVYTGTARKVCSGGGWWVVECEFSVLIWFKP